MKSPAVEEALRFLEAELAGGAGKGGEALPALTRMASAARVSLVSMWKAVGILKRQGVLRAVRGGRITLAYAGTPAPVVPPPELKWEKARKAVLQDIAAGHFAAGSRLPDQAGLRDRYAVAYPTLRKALLALAASGDLVPEGKRFRIQVQRDQAAYASIVLVAASGVDGEFGVLRDRGRGFLETLEAECSQAKVGLQVFKAESGHMPALLRALEKGSGELGCVLWPGEWQGRPETFRKVLAILEVLAARKNRVAVLDEMGDFDLPEKYLAGGRVRVFTISAFNAGLAAAKHLLALGHRKAAYLTPYRNLSWSFLRYAGLSRGFAQAGLAGQVALFDLQLDRNYNRVFHLGAFGGPEPGEALEWISGFLRMHLPKTTPAAHMASQVIQKKDFPRLSTELKFRLLDRFIEEQVNQEMEPLFKAAAGDASLTAWVGANDATALAASHFLGRMGRKVPKDVSILGFDNTPASLELGLTSYHFEITRFPKLMLRFLLNPPERIRASDHGPLEGEGVLIARRSTGKALKLRPEHR
ncbi:MAG: substrate-binding domain-containing protein [Fibrobacterota bacterium]|nr:substrate-binding domain-containing protein [Fibrobacterota bacterium]